MLVRELIQAYLATNPARRGREDHRHAAWWSDHMGREPVSTLTAGTIVRHLDRLASYGRSPSTVAFYLRFLRQVCAWGALLSYLPADPCASMALPKERTPPMRVLTEEEEGRLCAALGPPYGLWVKFAIETGLKQSEQFTLRWRDVDCERSRILLPATAGMITALDVSPRALEILQQLRHLHPPSLWVFPDLINPFRAVNIHNFYTGRWVTAVRKAGIPWVAWKDLRHTCGVRLTKRGLPVSDIVRVLRQREAKQAYVYRAWLAGRIGQPKQPPRVRQPVFSDEAGTDELRATILRDLNNHPLTFAEGARLYAIHHLRNRPSRRSFEQAYKQFFKPWADRPLTALTRKEVRAWHVGLAHIPGHANKALTLLRSLYNWALDLELIEGANPTLRIRRFAMPPRDRFLTLEELHRVMTGLPHLPPKPRAYLLMLLFTGARRGEACHIRWADIDEQTRLWKKPKTKNGTSQFIPLPSQVMSALETLPRRSEWVFPGQGGRAWSGGTAEKEWGTIRRRWGLDDVTLHDLRRTCASYLAMHGENLPTIQNVLNHRSLNPTSIYARLNTKAVDRALQAQADRFSSLQQTHVMPIEDAAASPGPRLIELNGLQPTPPESEDIEALTLVGSAAEWPG